MRRHDRWIELAGKLALRPTVVVACCYFLNKGWSPKRVAAALEIPLGIAQRVADAAKPFLRNSSGRGLSTRDFLVERDGPGCRYCGTLHGLQVDHVTPRSRGGTDDPDNLALACNNCNSAKGARTPQEWLG